jgi:hypothetical protein
MSVCISDFISRENEINSGMARIDRLVRLLNHYNYCLVYLLCGHQIDGDGQCVNFRISNSLYPMTTTGLRLGYNCAKNLTQFYDGKTFMVPLEI